MWKFIRECDDITQYILAVATVCFVVGVLDAIEAAVACGAN